MIIYVVLNILINFLLIKFDTFKILFLFNNLINLFITLFVDTLRFKQFTKESSL